MFFYRAPKESPDELVQRLAKERRVDQLEREIKKYKPSKINPEWKERYYHIWGKAPFKQVNVPRHLRGLRLALKLVLIQYIYVFL